MRHTTRDPVAVERRLSLPNPLLRLVSYYERSGGWATLQRAAVLTYRAIFRNRKVVFSCDLQGERDSLTSWKLPTHLSVERIEAPQQMAEMDWQKIMSIRTPELCCRVFSERFEKAACLWLIRTEGDLASYGWTLTGRSLEHHAYTFGKDDVHLFDFLVFPECRGRGINSALINHILGQLAREGKHRAYLEVEEWNLPSLISSRRTGLKPLGIERRSLRGKVIVKWKSPEAG